VKDVIPALLALSTVACTPGENVLPVPTDLITASNTLCGTQITSLDIEVNYAGPSVVIDVAFASSPAPVEIEIERYLADGRTEPVAALSNVVGRARVDLHFDTKYRARARAGSCPWSPWVDKQIGPANSCGDCKATPPPPPPPEPDDDDDDDDDGCGEDDHDDQQESVYKKPWLPVSRMACGG